MYLTFTEPLLCSRIVLGIWAHFKPSLTSLFPFNTTSNLAGDHLVLPSKYTQFFSKLTVALTRAQQLHLSQRNYVIFIEETCTQMFIAAL